MKNNRQEKIAVQLPVNIERDGQIEIQDDRHPVLEEIGNIKEQVLVSLTMRQWEKYLSMKGLEKTLYIRNKALALI